MRPVNLIPPEDRRGDHAPARTGPLAYVVVGGLAAALAAVTMVVLTSNTISDRQNEVASLQSQEDLASTEVTRLQSYANFATMEQNRELTVTSLADSRFDWQRTLRELAIVIPHNVWLTSLSGTASPDVQVGGSSSTPSSSASGDSSPTGPSLDILGCGASHQAVARFAAALQDIDGVTRVGVEKSDRSGQSGTTGSTSGSTATSGATSGASSASCQTRSFIAQFEIIVAFDQTTPVQAVAPAPPQPPAGSDAAGIANAQQQEQQARNSIQQQSDRAHNAVHTFIPGTGTP